ncbi:hypothetical protein [Nonomuraea dietziae]
MRRAILTMLRDSRLPDRFQVSRRPAVSRHYHPAMKPYVIDLDLSRR